jgi:hypothetical protein
MLTVHALYLAQCDVLFSVLPERLQLSYTVAHSQ